jgi:hypothetical protein
MDRDDQSLKILSFVNKLTILEEEGAGMKNEGGNLSE